MFETDRYIFLVILVILKAKTTLLSTIYTICKNIFAYFYYTYYFLIFLFIYFIFVYNYRLHVILRNPDSL